MVDVLIVAQIDGTVHEKKNLLKDFIDKKEKNLDTYTTTRTNGDLYCISTWLAHLF